MYSYVFYFYAGIFFIKNPKTLFIGTFILDFESQIFSGITDFWTHIYAALILEKHYPVPACR